MVSKERELRRASTGGPERSPCHRASRLRILALSVLAVAAFTGGCDDEGSAGPDAGVTIEDIISEPGDHLRQEIAVSAEVGEVFRPYAFTLKSGDTDAVLVVSSDRVQVLEASVVRAIGRVVETPIDPEEASPDVAAFIRNVVKEEHYEHAIVASEVHTLQEPGES